MREKLLVGGIIVFLAGIGSLAMSYFSHYSLFTETRLHSGIAATAGLAVAVATYFISGK